MNTVLLDLRDSALSLSQEGMSRHFKADTVTKLLPNFVNTVTSFITEKFGTANNAALNVNLVNVKEVERLARDTDLRELRYVKVAVPEGLTLDFLGYLSALEQMQDSLDDLQKDLLQPFDRMLSDWLANPDELRSRRSHSFMQVLMNRDSDQKAEALKGAFDPRQGDRRNYGDLVRRQNEWRSIAERYNRLVERYARINRKDVEDSVLTITEHLDVLLERIQADPDGYQMSGITLSDLAKVTYVLAEEVEHFALQGFMLKSLSPSLEAAIDAMKD